MGLRPTKSNENASGRARRINDLDRGFNGVVQHPSERPGSPFLPVAAASQTFPT
jgi:hypothetical protein